MPTIATTTLTDLETGMRTTIDAITPTISTERATGWIFADDNRMPDSSMVPRLYSFEWDKPTVVPGGATGNLDTEAGIVMSIVVDYRAFREETLAQVVESDHWDLADRFSDVWEGNGVSSVTGLTFTESAGYDARDAQRIVHKFTVQYMRARRVA